MACRTMFRDGSDRPQLDGEKAHSRRQGTHHPGTHQAAPANSPEPGAGGRGDADYPEARSGYPQGPREKSLLPGQDPEGVPGR